MNENGKNKTDLHFIQMKSWQFEVGDTLNSMDNTEGAPQQPL